MNINEDYRTETIITREFDGSMIGQRPVDGFVNATAMCQATGKRINNYLRQDSTKEFLKEMASVARYRATDLMHVRQGGVPHEQGTWVHPDVAINLAQWCSPKFAVAVSRWVREWMEGKHQHQQGDQDYLRVIARQLSVIERLLDERSSDSREASQPPLTPKAFESFDLRKNLALLIQAMEPGTRYGAAELLALAHKHKAFVEIEAIGFGKRLAKCNGWRSSGRSFHFKGVKHRKYWIS